MSFGDCTVTEASIESVASTSETFYGVLSNGHLDGEGDSSDTDVFDVSSDRSIETSTRTRSCPPGDWEGMDGCTETETHPPRGPTCLSLYAYGDNGVYGIMTFGDLGNYVEGLHGARLVDGGGSARYRMWGWACRNSLRRPCIHSGARSDAMKAFFFG